MLLGNGLTILAVFRFEKLRTRANMYIVSLAATDALVGLLQFVVELVDAYTDVANVWLRSFMFLGFLNSGYLLAVWMLLGNGLTILAVFRFEKLRTRANMYIVSLAATDALVGLLLFVAGSSYIPSVQSWVCVSKLLSVPSLGNVPYLLAVWVLLGNGLTILAVFRFEKLRTRANMYIVSLATSDALVGILLFFFGSLYIPSWRPCPGNP
nr:hypothetical protein BaRGS_027672 [Batillaria attramentaria]